MDRRTILTGLGGLGLAGMGGLFLYRRSNTEVVSDDDETTVHPPDEDGGPPAPPGKTDAGHDENRIELELEKRGAPDRVNSDSTSYFDDVFFICNRGKEPAEVWLETTPRKNGRGEPAVRFHPNRNYEQSIRGDGNAIEISARECLSVSVTTRTYGLSANEVLVDQVLVRTHRRKK
ncbi:hypothetical protein [Natrarchaeobaculum aegyptiacum]|uniref:DUF1102 domain-containing protein n=1 Tax=Natrarchaeobaculum aegyptiacum TaxID=745377 RepID=A0A2Z2HSV4_9EURY|nr:hypothetical protein [Natrarchaeobaculum aegyptiacum]ARS90296.1 hypothetical protein B1756_11560 [Natrarchaeobaculum aegyptiacum]